MAQNQHSNPRSQAENVRGSDNADSSKENSVEKKVAAAARRLASQVLQTNRNREGLSQLAAATATLSAGSAAAIERLQPITRPFGCAVGCSYCCYLLVTVSAPEVLLILRHLASTLSLEAYRAIKQRAAEIDDQTRGLDGFGRVIAGKPCPLLEDGKCSVYELRPLVCRGYYSYSWTACADNSRRCRVWKELPVEQVRRATYGATLDGVLEALPDVGLAGHPLDLVAALRIGLETPDIEQRWLAGEDVFADAVEVESRRQEAKMKRSVNGRTYDTDQFDAVAEFAYGKEGDTDFEKETLYCGPDGFFLAGLGGPESYYAQLFDGAYVDGEDVIPLTPDEARRWLEDQGLTEAIHQIFGDDSTIPPKGHGQIEIPKAALAQARRAAKRANMPLEDWIERLIDEATADTSSERPSSSPLPMVTTALDVTPADDGAVVEDQKTGQVHFLNATAAYALSLCDGETPPERIAEQIQVTYGLPEPPTEVVKEILSQFADEGLIERDS